MADGARANGSHGGRPEERVPRSADARWLANLLRLAPLTLLHGEAGAGKSTLLRCEVLPLLQRRAADRDPEQASSGQIVPFPDRRRRAGRIGGQAEVAVLFDTWDSDPLERLRHQVGDALGCPPTEAQRALPLADYLAEATRLHGVFLLLVLDEFDTVLSAAADDDAAAVAFTEALVDTLTRPDLPVNLFLVTRSDTAPGLMRLRDRIPGFGDRWLRIRHWLSGLEAATPALSLVAHDPTLQADPGTGPKPDDALGAAPEVATAPAAGYAARFAATPVAAPAPAATALSATVRVAVPALSPAPASPLWTAPEPTPAPGPVADLAPPARVAAPAPPRHPPTARVVVVTTLLLLALASIVGLTWRGRAGAPAAPAPAPRASVAPAPAPFALLADHGTAEPDDLAVALAAALVPSGRPAPSVVTDGGAAPTPFALVRHDALQSGFDDPAAPAPRVVAPMYLEDVLVLVRVDSPMRTMADLAGRRINVGPVGRPREVTARSVYTRLFGAPLPPSSTDEASLEAALQSLLGPGRVDAIVLVAAQPSSWLARQTPHVRASIRLLPWRLDGVAPLDTDRTTQIYLSTPLQAGPGPGARTLSSMQFLVAGADVDDASIAAAVRSLCDRQRGRNNFLFYVPQMNDQAVERLQLESQLRQALERDEFLLHYQPKVNLASGEISGFEALLRWQHPQRGMVPPLDFISILEDTGMIVPVGEWVLRTVCRQLALWKSQGLPLRPVAINLSARQFQDKGLEEVVRAIVAEEGGDPSLLEFELTESMLMADAESAARTMSALKAYGVRLSVDDFGTGYSSLSYLKRFPIDALKIDRSFMRDVTTDDNDASIALAIIRLAHSLKLDVVAEGVETAAQLAFLQSHECDQMQGYFFSRPLAVADCTQALSEGRCLADLTLTP